jgi:site-specific DNA-cytosine methylase
MLRLSSFPADYPLCGTKRERTMLVGNSVPPRLAQHVVASAMEGVA